MLIFAGLCVLSAVSSTYAQQYETTPVPILKQINRQNNDGSYTYGYEAADKSFKIETKYQNGEVFGKYGYVDDQGKVREIEYGASQRGFEPAGSDINVPPPTLTSSNPYPLGANEIDDGQYREDPSVYYKNEVYSSPMPAMPPSKFSLNDFHPKAAYNPAPAAQPPAQPAAPQYMYYNAQAPTVPRYQPTYQAQTYHQPEYHTMMDEYHWHPAVNNFDLFRGSYSIDYTARK